MTLRGLCLPTLSFYLTDMENKDSDYEALYSAMETIIEKKIYEVLDRLGVEASDYAIVNSISDYDTDETDDTVVTSVRRATVKLPNGEQIDNLYNSSGEVLAPGDKVKIFGSRKNTSNRYIGMKYV